MTSGIQVIKEISFITLQPDLVTSHTSVGVFGRAQKFGLLDVRVVNLRNYALDHHGTVDSRPYGGGDGMILRPEPLAAAVRDFAVRPYIINVSPAGQRWCQKKAVRLSQLGKPLAFVAGRFGGVDQRFTDRYCDAEFSLGDYILSNGDLAALAISDSIVRLLPGVLGNSESSEVESFAEHFHGLLEPESYSRPEVFEGLSVPEVLVSGDHAKIQKWREERSRNRTRDRRPDLLSYSPNF